MEKSLASHKIQLKKSEIGANVRQWDAAKEKSIKWKSTILKACSAHAVPAHLSMSAFVGAVVAVAGNQDLFLS